MIGAEIDPMVFKDLGKVAMVTTLEVSESAVEDFCPIKLKNLIPGYPVPFSLFFPIVKRSGRGLFFAKLLEKDELYTTQMEEFFTDSKIEAIYVHTDALSGLGDYLEGTTRACVSSPTVPVEQKTQVIYSHAEFLVERLYRDPEVGHVLNDVSKWSKMVGKFLLKDEITPAYLSKIFSKDYSTFTHSIQVCLLGMAFGADLEWREEEIAEFGVGGLFHDLGKIWIDDRILQKPGRLTEEEFEHIREHPRFGYQYLKGMDTMPPRALKIVLQHHEGADGKGYPLGLKKDEIHPFARVIHLVDCYDALTTRRPYKGPLPPFKALKLMNEEMRESFDMELLKRFIHFLGR